MERLRLDVLKVEELVGKRSDAGDVVIGGKATGSCHFWATSSKSSQILLPFTFGCAEANELDGSFHSVLAAAKRVFMEKHTSFVRH